MDRNFARALKLVLKYEGGYVNHPKDPGGATNKGITIATFRRFVNPKGTVDDLKRITDAQVATVYRKQYWNAVKGDDLPDGVDFAVFDFAVNSGPARAAKYLQKVLKVAQDGQIGPATIGAAKAASASGAVKQLCDDRMTFLRGLKTWGTFGKGWSSRVAGVRAAALDMAGQAAPPAAAKPFPSAEEARAAQRADDAAKAKYPPKPVAPPVPTPAAKPSLWAALLNLILKLIGRKPS